MLNRIKSYIGKKLDMVPREYHVQLIVKSQKQNTRIQLLENLLANENALGVTAKSLTISQHALHRYRQRIGYTNTDDELRKMLYKGCMRHLATMDKLSDGNYQVGQRGALAVIKDNTVVTIKTEK